MIKLAKAKCCIAVGSTLTVAPPSECQHKKAQFGTKSKHCESVCVWLLYRQPRMPRALSHVVFGVVYYPPDADDKAMTSQILGCPDAITRDQGRPAGRLQSNAVCGTPRCCPTRYGRSSGRQPEKTPSWTKFTPISRIGMSGLSSCQTSARRTTEPLSWPGHLTQRAHWARAQGPRSLGAPKQQLLFFNEWNNEKNCCYCCLKLLTA